MTHNDPIRIQKSESTDGVMRLVFPENTVGYDYIVGDIHGCLPQLQKFIELMFDKNVDRLFSVGDLIDRGMYSLECLQKIDESWFHAVSGNHELMFVNFMIHDDMNFIYNGGIWVNHLPQGEETDLLLQTFCKKLQKEIPRMITIEGADKVHIVHAEFPTITRNFKPVPVIDAHFDDDLSLQNLMWDDSTYWNRHIFEPWFVSYDDNEYIEEDHISFNSWNSDKLSLVVSGHTPVKSPLRYGKLLNIDTGAVFETESNKRFLTFYDVKRKKCWKVSANSDDVEEVAIIEVVKKENKIDN